MKTTRVFMEDYSKITIKNKHLVLSDKLIYQNQVLYYENNKSQIKFNIYELAIAKGSLNKPVYLITLPGVDLNSGKQWLAIKPIQAQKLKLDFSDDKILDEIYKHYKFPLAKDERWDEFSENEKWERLYHQHLKKLINGTPIFFSLVKPLSKEEINEIKTWDFEKLEHDYFYEGLTKDEKIVYVYRGQVISFETDPHREEDTCKNTQPYNSNAVLSTTTKRGKTSLGRKIGSVYASATSARILGFSTADSTYSGDADGEYEPFFLDNVHNFEPNILAGILELLETGETKTGKGKQTIVTRSLSSFTLHANPPDVDNAQILAQSFADLINLMTLTVQGPVGSRFAVIFFMPRKEDTIPVSGTPLNDEIIQKNKLIFSYIIKEVNKEVATKIFRSEKVQSWLNKNIENYAKQIDKFLIASEEMLPSAISEFWRHHALYSHRHIRGVSLKQAIMDNKKEIFLGNYSIDKILEDADAHVDRVRNINIVSLQNMLNILTSKPKEEWLKEKYENIKDFNAKAVVLTVVAYAHKNPQTVKKDVMLALETLSDCYDDLKENYKTQGYKYFSNVLHKIPIKNLEQFNRKLGDFGFHLVKTGEKEFPTVVFTKDSSQLELLAKRLFSPQKTLLSQHQPIGGAT